MKIFWWQGGLQIQPDTEVETEALLVLLNAVRYERPLENDDPRTARAQDASALGEAESGLDVGL
jgi:hypothetical protein